MKVSGFTLVRNAVQFDYPFLESLRSLLPLVDELIINVGIGDDSTLQEIETFSETEGLGKVRFFVSDWELHNPEKKRGGLILSEQTNLALQKCTGDWCFYLQADEVLHESDRLLIRETLEKADPFEEIEGLLFDYIHFYGSYDVIQKTRSAYRREVRLIRRRSGAESEGDAQSFRHSSGRKLRVLKTEARVYHYGWVRAPEVMKEKTFHFDQLYHGDPSQANASARVPHTGDNYRYKKIWGLVPFIGKHPEVMSNRIQSKNWNWDLRSSSWVFSWQDIPKIALDLFERATNIRMFEYRSYQLKNLPSTQGPLFASLFVSTYNMPKHLALVCAGLERQTTQKFEIFFCDDGSGPETKKVIDTFQTQTNVPVHHIWQENQGFRKCEILNKALKKATGTLCIFLDGDCVPHSRFIQDHLEQAESGYYLAGRRVEVGEKLMNSLSEKDVRNGFFDFPHLRLIFSIFKGDSEYLNRTVRVSWNFMRKLFRLNTIADLKGCNYSVAREALIAINGFDESFQGYGREDTDVEIRLQNLGLKIKSLKGLALQFHLWHPRRDFTPGNEGRLESTRLIGRIRCEKGLV